MPFIPDEQTNQSTQSFFNTENFGQRFLQNLISAPKKVFYDIPKATIAEPLGELVKPPLRSLAQVGVASGRSLRGENPIQPAYLPGPYGKYLGNVGIGTTGEEVQKGLESLLTVSPETVLKPLAPIGRGIGKIAGKGAVKLAESALNIGEKIKQMGRSPAAKLMADMPITTESGLKKWLQTSGQKMRDSINSILASRYGKISVFTNEVKKDAIANLVGKTAAESSLSTDAAKNLIERAVSKLKLGEKGAHTLQELNEIRVGIDKGIPSSVWGKTYVDPKTQAAVQKALADAIRNKVKGLAPETIPFFDKWSALITGSKELNKGAGSLSNILKKYAGAGGKLGLFGTVGAASELFKEKPSLQGAGIGALAGIATRGVLGSTVAKTLGVKALQGMGNSQLIQAARLLPALFGNKQVQKSRVSQSNIANQQIVTPTGFIPD